MHTTITFYEAPGQMATQFDAPRLDVPASAFGFDLTEALTGLLTPEASTCVDCSAGIGAGLAGEADERIEWSAAAVRLHGDDPESAGVATICLDCAQF